MLKDLCELPQMNQGISASYILSTKANMERYIADLKKINRYSNTYTEFKNTSPELAGLFITLLPEIKKKAIRFLQQESGKCSGQSLIDRIMAERGPIIAGIQNYISLNTPPKPVSSHSSLFLLQENEEENRSNSQTLILRR